MNVKLILYRFIFKIIFILIFIKIFLIDICYSNEKFYIKNININLINNKNYRELVYKKLLIYKNNYISKYDLNIIIKKIFDENLISDIKVYIENNNLILKIKENLKINKIKFYNNKILSNKIIKKYLKEFNLLNKEIFVKKKLFKFDNTIKELYKDKGKFNIKIKYDLVKKDNYYNILIKFNEGDFFKIKNIDILGNKNINKSEIIKELKENFFFKNIYKRKKFEKKIIYLENKYKNLGYIDFKIDNLYIKLNNKHNEVLIKLIINEGNRYLINNFTLCEKNINKKDIEYIKNIYKKIKKNEYYSNEKIEIIKNKIKKYLITKGYYKPNINFKIINLNKNKININIIIYHKNKINIRYIKIKGNDKIIKKIIEKKITQKKNSVFKILKIKKDIKNIKKLNYFNSVKFYTENINKNNNTVDLIYLVKESNFNKFNINFDFKKKYINIFFDLNKINWFNTENSIFFGFDYNKLKYNFLFKVNKLYPNKNKKIKKITKIFKKSTFLSDNNSLNTFCLSNYINIPINKKLNFNYGISMLKNNIYINEYNDNYLNYLKNFNIIKKKKYIKSNNKFKKISYNNFDIFSKLNFIKLNNTDLPYKGISVSINSNNSSFLSKDKLYKIYFKYNKYNKIKFLKNFVLNNKINIFIINSLNEEIPFYENIINNNINNIRGFEDNYLFNKKNSDINFNKLDYLFDINNINNKLILTNELIFIFKKYKYINKIFQTSIFLDSEIYFNKNFKNKNYLNLLKNKFIKHYHISTGFSFKLLSPLGLIKINYSIPIRNCNLSIFKKFKFDIIN